MKRFLVVAAACAATCAFGAPAALASQSTTGNGGPSGPHFDLNIHGVDKGSTFTGFNGNNQNDIFVQLNTNDATPCKIVLQQAMTYDFQVLQPNCVSNPTAEFELPSPCFSPTDPLATCGTSGDTYYSVYVRALGKPGGSSQTTPCFTDTTGTTYCSLNSVVAVRGYGQSKFTNQTDNLLFITYCTAPGTSTSTVTVPIFDNSQYQYFWNYDNDGLRLAQFRFYQIPNPYTTGSGTSNQCLSL